MGFFRRWVCAPLLFLFAYGTASGEGGPRSPWSLEFRYGAAEYASPCATLPLSSFGPGRYVELSFLPTGAPEYWLLYTLTRDSSLHLTAGLGFQTYFTTLDVSDSSFRSFAEGEYPVATLRISQIRGVVHGRMYSDLPFGLGVGMLRAGAGISYVWAAGTNVLEQGRAFPKILSIRPQSLWLLAMDAGLGYAVPGSPLTLTANVTLNLQMEFVSNRDFLAIVLDPASPYRFESASVSPVYLSLGILIDI